MSGRRLWFKNHRNQTALQATVEAAERDLPELTAELVAGQQHTQPPTAAAALRDQLQHHPPAVSRRASSTSWSSARRQRCGALGSRRRPVEHVTHPEPLHRT